MLVLLLRQAIRTSRLSRLQTYHPCARRPPPDTPALYVPMRAKHSDVISPEYPSSFSHSGMSPALWVGSVAIPTKCLCTVRGHPCKTLRSNIRSHPCNALRRNLLFTLAHTGVLSPALWTGSVLAAPTGMLAIPNGSKAPVYTVQVVEKIDHDMAIYTQGMAF